MPAVERQDPPREAPEREMLGAWLDFHRATLVRKCAGLSAEELGRASCPPSDLTLLGLVRHLTDVERGWFARTAGHEAPPIYYSDEDPEGDLRLPDPLDDDQVERVFELWQEQCERSRRVVDGLSSLDETVLDDGEPLSWRWIITHMVEEYARHNGHADLLRQAIDGATGE